MPAASRRPNNDVKFVVVGFSQGVAKARFQEEKQT